MGDIDYNSINKYRHLDFCHVRLSSGPQRLSNRTNESRVSTVTSYTGSATVTSASATTAAAAKRKRDQDLSATVAPVVYRCQDADQGATAQTSQGSKKKGAADYIAAADCASAAISSACSSLDIQESTTTVTTTVTAMLMQTVRYEPFRSRIFIDF